MAEVHPFRGLRYNKSVVGDIGAVICPPYDIITPKMEEELYQSSPYNFIHIEHNRQLPQDSDTDNRYTRSAEIMNKWLRQGVLVTDDTPALYIHDHCFIHRGRELWRRGLTVTVKLEEWHRNVVRPHEGTLAEPKDDRINLLWALGANTSSILAMFDDGERQIYSLLAEMESGKPIITAGHGGEKHHVWTITEPRIADEICRSFNRKPLYIADGHHRYESALTYQRQQLARTPAASPKESFNFVMMTLVDFNDPGLVILPPHRLLRGLPPSKVTGLADKLASFFDIQELSLDVPGAWQRVDELLNEAGSIRLVLFGLADRNLLILTLHDLAAASQMMPYFHSELYKRLDVSLVDHIILEELLGLSGEDEAKISYNYNRQDAVNQVLTGAFQLAFIISPVKAQTIKAIADAGDRMPRKSTYFYPKLPSGLVFNRLG
ncbi:MAG: DUF1015 domain-containing protein [Dehalococcoidales bacterium]|nr:DUF1015 domain-containing protein [Dehalococcoidales bacterium]